MRKTIIAALAALLYTPLFAQQIATPNTTIDCGQVIFRQPVKAEFQMKNNGSEPLLISDVRTSCGCTTVSYPTEPVAAGATFTISATYDAKTMGHFQKQIGIYSNAAPEPLMLTIKGVVVDKKSSFGGEYKFQIGDVKADANDLEFDNVNRGDMPIQKIHIKNESDDVVEPQLMHLPPYLKGEVKPSRIAPGHKGTVTLQLDSKKLRDLGLTQTSIYLGMFPGDKVSPDKEISMNIILMPDFEQLSDAQRANAPKLRLSEGSIDVGFVNGKEKDKADVTISNEGKTMLTIRSLQMLTTGLQLSLNKQNIKPGEKAKLKVSVDFDELRKARTLPRILMITNDPEQSKVVIPIRIYERSN